MGNLKALRFDSDDEGDGQSSIRQEAIRRVTGQETSTPPRRKRRVFPSEEKRRERTIAITFPEQAQMDSLKQAAAKLSQECGREVSPTRLGTLLLVAGLELWNSGQLELATEATKVETMVIKLRHS